MKEVKTPKKPLIFYYVLVCVVMLLLNFLLFPRFLSAQVKEVDYGTFLKMVDDGEVKEVEVQDNQIVFSDKEENTNYYKTGRCV